MNRITVFFCSLLITSELRCRVSGHSQGRHYQRYRCVLLRTLHSFLFIRVSAPHAQWWAQCPCRAGAAPSAGLPRSAAMERTQGQQHSIPPTLPGHARQPRRQRSIAFRIEYLNSAKLFREWWFSNLICRCCANVPKLSLPCGITSTCAALWRWRRLYSPRLLAVRLRIRLWRTPNRWRRLCLWELRQNCFWRYAVADCLPSSSQLATRCGRFGSSLRNWKSLQKWRYVIFGKYDVLNWRNRQEPQSWIYFVWVLSSLHWLLSIDGYDRGFTAYDCIPDDWEIPSHRHQSRRQGIDKEISLAILTLRRLKLPSISRSRSNASLLLRPLKRRLERNWKSMSPLKVYFIWVIRRVIAYVLVFAEQLDSIFRRLGLQLPSNGPEESTPNPTKNPNPAASPSQLIDELISHFVEPITTQPTFLIDHPILLSPLARKHREKVALNDCLHLFFGDEGFFSLFSLEWPNALSCLWTAWSCATHIRN